MMRVTRKYKMTFKVHSNTHLSTCTGYLVRVHSSSILLTPEIILITEQVYGGKLGSSWFVRIMTIPNRSILLTILTNKTYRTPKERSLLQPRTLTQRTEILRHSVICGSKGKVNVTAVVPWASWRSHPWSRPLLNFLLGEIVNSIG